MYLEVGGNRRRGIGKDSGRMGGLGLEEGRRVQGGRVSFSRQRIDER